MSKIGFNLLKPQIEPPTVRTKIYDWIVGTARLIVIVVEIIVIVAFGIRLVLDVQGNKLTEDIEAKERTLRSLQLAESRYTRIQNKTRAFNVSWTDAIVYTDLFVEINSYLPNDIVELSIQITDEQISITGKASVSEIGNLETSFKNSSSFVNTELVEIESSGASSGQLAEFTLRTKLRNADKREIPDDILTTIN